MSNVKISKMHKRVNASADERKLSPLGAADHPVPENSFWDEATSLYVTSIQGLEDTHGLWADYLKETLSTPEGKARIQDEAELVDNINLLTRDVAKHVELLNEIYASHKDKTGGSQTPDEHMAVIAINGRYHDAIELYNTVIMPTVTHIFEQTGVIQQATSDAAAAQLSQVEADIINPDVVTDVQIKEVTSV